MNLFIMNLSGFDTRSPKTGFFKLSIIFLLIATMDLPIVCNSQQCQILSNLLNSGDAFNLLNLNSLFNPVIDIIQ